MLNKQYYTGTVRGYGYAKMIFDHLNVFFKKNQHSKILERVHKVSNFSPTMVQRAASLTAGKDDPKDLYKFWLTLFLVKVVEDGGICIDASFVVDAIDPGLPLEEVISLDDLLFLDKQPDGKSYLYFKEHYEFECYLAAKIGKLIHSQLNKIQLVFGEDIGKKSQDNLTRLFSQSLSFITGGPGTGKTTTIKQVLKTAIDSGIGIEKIALCAPTGKAVKRIRESCNELFTSFPALKLPVTIHRLLGYNSEKGHLQYTEKNPLNYDLIIIDEASMIDLQIMFYFMKAIPDNQNLRIVFAGDPNQLLSVKAGSVFADLISLKHNTLLLEKTYRQGEGSQDILLLANDVRNGNADIAHYVDDFTGGVRFLAAEKVEDFKRMILYWLKKFNPVKLSSDAPLESCQILTPVNETELGVKGLNLFIQSYYFPEAFIDERKFHSGEPIIFTGNLYDLNVFNGETGYIEEKNGEWYFIQSENGEKKIKINRRHISRIELSYAITIHKSQGSEFDHVCIVIPEANTVSGNFIREEILSRRLLYTGITRAKKTVTIIGAIPTWEKIVQEPEIGRKSLLAERIKTHF